MLRITPAYESKPRGMVSDVAGEKVAAIRCRAMKAYKNHSVHPLVPFFRLIALAGFQLCQIS
jgi:hypothetical protein